MNLFGWLLELATDIFHLRQRVNMTSQEIAAIKVAYQAFRNDVVSIVTGLQAKIADLRKQLESAIADPVAVDELLKEIEADHIALMSAESDTAEIVDPSA